MADVEPGRVLHEAGRPGPARHLLQEAARTYEKLGRQREAQAAADLLRRLDEADATDNERGEIDP